MPAFLAPILMALAPTIITTMAIAQTVASAIFLVGGMILSSSQTRKAKRKAREQFNAAQADRLVNVSSPTAARELVLGRVRKGGTVFFKGTTGTNKTTFLMAIALAGHEIDAVEAVYFNDQLVSYDGAGNVTTAPYGGSRTVSGSDNVVVGANTLTNTPLGGVLTSQLAGIGGPDGDQHEIFGSLAGNIYTSPEVGYVQYQYTQTTVNANVRFVLGAAGQTADARMVSLFPGLWTTAHRAQGVAYMVVECTYDETAYPTGLPNVTAVIRGAKLYDPRHNLATYSEQFDHANWQKSTLTVTANTVVAPDFTTTADVLTATGADSYAIQFANIAALSTYTFSIWLKAPSAVTTSINSRHYPSLTDVYELNVNVTTSWQRFVLTGTTVAGTTSIHFGLGGFGGLSTGEVVHAWGAQLVTGALPLPYSRTSASAKTPSSAWSRNPALMMRYIYAHPSFGKASYPLHSGNLLSYSEDFLNAYWTKNAVPVAAGVTAPDGTASGQKLNESATTAVFDVYKLYPTTAGEKYTVSYYVKAAERSLVSVSLCTGGLADGAYAYFNLAAGTVSAVVNTGANSGGTAQVLSVGNGWYRCSISITAATTANRYPGLGIKVTETTAAHAGTAGTGLYVWGAQLNEGLSPTVYAKTTTGPVGPATGTVRPEEDERFIAAANVCERQQSYVESGAANLLTYSDDFSNSVWIKSGVSSVVSNDTLAPNGTMTADKIILSGASDPYCAQTYDRGATIGGVTFTFSVYAWIDAGQSTEAVLYIYDHPSATYVYTKAIVLTTTPTQYTFTATINVASAVNIVTARVDFQNISPPVGTYAYLWGASLRESTVLTRDLYRASLVTFFGSPADDVLDDLAQAMGGAWAFAGGQMYLKAGSWLDYTSSISDADLAVVSRDGAGETQNQISITVHQERAQKFNTVTATIWDWEQEYKQVTLSPVKGTALVARDGAELVQAVDFSAIGNSQQAQHVAGILMREARDSLVVQIPLKMRCYAVELFDFVAVTLARYGWSAKTFMVIGRDWSADGSLQLTLKESAEANYTMDADFLAQGYAVNTSLPSPWYVPPVGTLTVTSGTAELVTQADGTVVSRIRVAWPPVLDSSVTTSGVVEVQYRSASSSGEWQSVVVTGVETQVVISDVQDQSSYTIRARAKSSQAVGQWGTQTNHTVIGKTEPPPQFDFFTVLAQPDGTRQYNFGYSTLAAQPVDWLGAEIRYVSGTVGSPDWDTMTRLQDLTSYYTHSPVELNSPLSGAFTFACKSLDTSGNLSTYRVVSITLPDRRLGNVFSEYFEGPEGWLGTKTSCHVQDAILVANDSTTWATAPATWAGLTRWVFAPSSPVYYETPAKNFGAIISGQINSVVDADGTVVQEFATSTDGVSWGSWTTATAAFTTRHLKMRLTVTATGPMPVPLIRAFSWQVNSPTKSEYINDLVISGLTGSYRIGVGDIRIPLAGVYTVLKRTDVVIQDGTAGTWTATRIDQTLTYGPRWQFRLGGTLTDPAFVDFFIEGY